MEVKGILGRVASEALLDNSMETNTVHPLTLASVTKAQTALTMECTFTGEVSNTSTATSLISTYSINSTCSRCLASQSHRQNKLSLSRRCLPNSRCKTNSSRPNRRIPTSMTSLMLLMMQTAAVASLQKCLIK